MSGLQCSISLSVWIFISHMTVTSSFSSTVSMLWSYYFSLAGSPCFLQISQCRACATLSCLQFLYWHCANILHSAKIWATVSSRSTHILHFESMPSLSMTFLMYFVLIACSCAAISKPSVSFFMPLFLNHSHVFSPLTSSVALKNLPCKLLFLYLSCLSNWIVAFSLPSPSSCSFFIATNRYSSLSATCFLKLLISIFTHVFLSSLFCLASWSSSSYYWWNCILFSITCRLQLHFY